MDESVVTGVKSGVGGITRGGNHSVAADPILNQVYVPIASTSNLPGTSGTVCGTGNINGCIAVFTATGDDKSRPPQ